MNVLLLPPNATQLERDFASLIYELFSGLMTPIEAIKTLKNPMTCPVQFLPWLAWERHVDVWDDGWSEQRKRTVVAESYATHAIKGTLASVQKALVDAGYADCKIQEVTASLFDGQNNYDGTVNYDANQWYKVTVVMNAAITNTQAATIRRLVLAHLPARCQLTGLVYNTSNNTFDGTLQFDGTYNYGIG